MALFLKEYPQYNLKTLHEELNDFQMGILLKSAMDIKSDRMTFEAKIRGYELQKPIDITPMSDGDWKVVLKEIKKKQLEFNRDKKAIKLNRKR